MLFLDGVCVDGTSGVRFLRRSANTHERKRLERLYRYISRSVFAGKRLSLRRPEMKRRRADDRLQMRAAHVRRYRRSNGVVPNRSRAT